jgi:hypothetical protein
MARYYFHVQSGDTINADEEGLDLPSLNVAQEEALGAARDLLAEAIRFGKREVPTCVIVYDDAGRELAKVAVKDVLPQQFL